MSSLWAFGPDCPRLSFLRDVAGQYDRDEVLDLRVTGSSSRALLARDPIGALSSLSVKSDVDLQMIVSDASHTAIANKAADHCEVARPPNDYPLICVKGNLSGFLVSFHVYSSSGFSLACSPRRHHFRWYRSRLSAEYYDSRGLDGYERVRWAPIPASEGFEYELNRRLGEGRELFIDPYYNMALTGISVLDGKRSQAVDAAVDTLISAVLQKSERAAPSQVLSLLGWPEMLSPALAAAIEADCRRRKY